MHLTLRNNITIEGATSKERAGIISGLTLLNPEYEKRKQFKRSTYGVPKYIKLFSETKNTITAPRGYIYDLLKCENVTLNDQTIHFPPISINTNIKYRALQEPWVASLLSFPVGIGIAPPGVGKTTMAIAALAKLGQPTLWITHREPLMVQFIERVEEFIGDVGEIGVMGDGKNSLGDLITVGSVNTLLKMDLKKLGNLFGTIFLDECHHVPSVTFKKVATQFWARNIYALTATPYREDKLESVMYKTMGPITAKISRDEAIDESLILPACIKTRYISWHQKANYTEWKDINKLIQENEVRNNQIVLDVLCEAALNHLCIVLTVSVEHGKILKEKLCNVGVPTEHIHGKLYKPTRNKLIKKFQEGEARVLVATYSLLSEGFDNKHASRLFFAAPRKAEAMVTQAIGRIERVAEYKVDAIAYDYADSITVLMKQHLIRKDIYTENKMKIID